MKRFLRWLGIGASVVIVIAAIAAAGLWWYVGRIGVERVTERLYMLTGLGGNVAVLVTDDGAVVVDSMTMVRQGSAILSRIADLTDKPVVTMINTHYHLDHTHGNPAFAPRTRMIATERTLEHLKTRDAEYWAEPPASQLLPNETFTVAREYGFGSHQVRMIHPGCGHTDGDLVVLFVGEKVLHTGDLFFHGHYPNIDLEAGGTVRGWIDTLDRVKELQFDRIIPGHGLLTDRAGLERFQDFLRALWTKTSDVVAAGGSLADAKKDVDLSSFGLAPIWFAPYLNHDFVVGRAYEEAAKSGDR